MGIRLPICIALALAGTIQVSANVTDMRCEYRVDHYIPAFSTLAFYPPGFFVGDNLFRTIFRKS